MRERARERVRERRMEEFTSVLSLLCTHMHAHKERGSKGSRKNEEDGGEEEEEKKKDRRRGEDSKGTGRRASSLS